MQRDRFGRWAHGVMLRGHQHLAETLRVLVYKSAPELFERLEFDNDACFLEPLLFAWFTAAQRDIPLEQLLYGILAPERRPERMTLYVDARGRLFVPGLGELQIDANACEIELRYDPNRDEFECACDGRALPVRWERSPRVDGTDIEIFRHGHALFHRFFVDGNGDPVDIDVNDLLARHMKHLSAAFELVAAYCPDVAAHIAATTRRILLYRAPAPNSFAALSAHGAVFLNVPESADSIFFLEDVSHQCAHVMFNALTLDKERFLAVDPNTALGEIVADLEEPRDVYGAYHGLFTYTVICRVLSTLNECSVFGGRQAHELLGRLGFTLRKFGSDLARLDRRHLFTARGYLCYRRFAAQYAYYMARARRLTERLDFSNQPYNFSYERFAASNPLEATASEACAS